MQTRSQKKITSAEEQTALKVLVKPKASRKRPAPVADAAPDSAVPPPKKIPGKKRSAHPIDAAEGIDAPPLKKRSGRKRSTPPADAAEDRDTPPLTQKPARKRFASPTEVPLAAPPTKEPRRRRSTPPAEALPNTSPPSPPETPPRVRLALGTGTRPDIEASPSTGKPSRKRSVSLVDISAPRPKKKKTANKAVRFVDEHLTPLEQLEEVKQLFEEDETNRHVLDGISTAFSNGMAEEILNELAESEFAGEDAESETNDSIIADDEHEENEQVPEVEDSQPTTQSGDDIVSTELTIQDVSAPKSILRPKDHSIKLHYQSLKKLAWTWITTHFSTISPSAAASLSLFDLVDTHPQLMEYANYISSCGPNTWESVFNEQRAWLVFGILGKMLEVHVFGCEMFGASEVELGVLRERDVRMMNEDGMAPFLCRIISIPPHPQTTNIRLQGFLRQRTRAGIISDFMNSPKSPTTPFPSHFHSSLSILHASFLSLLSPLLPSPLPPTLATDLSTILHTAATLSLTTRLSPDVIYNWQTHPAVGEVFEPREMHMLNPRSVNGKGAMGERGRCDLEIVRMVGWPGCVAYRSYTGTPEAAVDDDNDDADCNAKLSIGSSSSDNNDSEKERTKPPKPVIVGKAEVVVSWGPPNRPLKAQATNWLGPRLRVEMKRRLEARDREERKNVLAAGGLVGTALAGAWMVGQPWFGRGLEGVMGWGQEVLQRGF